MAEKKTIEVTLPEITYARFEELANAMGLTVEDAAAEIIKERVRGGQWQTVAAASLPVLEAQVFTRCSEAMSVLTEPESIGRVFVYLQTAHLAMLSQRERELKIELDAFLQTARAEWKRKIDSGELVLPPEPPPS
jgi:hypothetical protein